MKGTDQCIALQSELWRADLVEKSQHYAEMRQAGLVPAVYSLDVLHEQQVLVGMKHTRHGQVAFGGQVTKHMGFRGQVMRPASNFRDDRVAVVQVEPERLTDFAAGKRPRSDNSAVDDGSRCVGSAMVSFHFLMCRKAIVALAAAEAIT